MESSTQKYIIDVVPLTKISLSRQQFFSYLSYEKIEKGTLVAVPFFRRSIQGIVVNCRTDFHRLGNFTLKNIQTVLERSFLTEQQMAVAEFISQSYFSSLGKTLKHFIPQRVSARKFSTINKTVTKSISLTDEQMLAISEIKASIQSNAYSSFLLFGPASSGKTEVYINAASSLSDGQQALILLPELTLTPQAIQRYGDVFGERVAVLHSKLSKGEYYRNWLRIRSGEAKVIVSTRSGIFAPFKNLSLIIVDEEQDISFKQWDMTPRFDAREVADFLAKLWKATIIFGSATPRIETYYKSTQNEIKFLELSSLHTKLGKSPKQIEIIDMRKEKWQDFSGKRKPNYSFLSRKLQEEISYALNHKLQVILFINHQGMSGFSVCNECKTLLACPKCDRALVYHNDGEYHCLHCNYKSGPIATCKNCNGISFKNIGIGTQAVEREVKKMFPFAKTLRADMSTTKNQQDFENIYENFKSGQSDILIGTQMISKGWDLPRVGLVGIIDADSMRSIPDFNSDQRAFGHFMQVAGRTGRIDSLVNGLVLIQTYDPNNSILKFVAETDYKGFVEKQLKERETLKYPPFSRLYKLVFQHEDESKAESEAKKIESKIRIITNERFSIYGPQKPLISKVRGKHRQQILIKDKFPNDPLTHEFVKILQSLGEGWFVDVDPIQII